MIAPLAPLVALVGLVAIVVRGAGGGSSVIQVPADMRGAPLEYSVVCRTPAGEFEGVTTWTGLQAGELRLARRPGRCRVALRRRGTAVYRLSGYVDWLSVSPRFDATWRRTMRAPAIDGDVTWVGTSDASGVECARARDETVCLGVPAGQAGVMVAKGVGAIDFAVHATTGTAVSAWQRAPWGRLVRVRSPRGAPVTAAVRVLSPAFRSAASRLFEARPTSSAEVQAVAVNAFWVAGKETQARLDLSAGGCAPRRIPLADVAGPSDWPLDVSLELEETIEGDVISRGAILDGATLLLMRILDTREVEGLRIPEESETERHEPVEFVAETVSDAIGRFAFRGLARGRYLIVALHTSRGRARVEAGAPSRPRIRLEPRAVARGRVLRDGVPAASAVVSVLPDVDVVGQAVDPTAVVAAPVRTSLDGRFEIALPEEGRAALTIVHPDGVARLALGELDRMPSVVDLGDVRLEAPLDVDVVVDLEAGCVLQTAGPIGALGMSVVRALPVAPGRWSLRLRLPGRWLFEASCGGTAVRLAPALVSIDREQKLPLRIDVVR